ncbi:hypothetical protein FJW06_17070 [Mesorhizobium sp. B4-1-3]|uniref:hypothetical protein n=1 Tax=Mesorhizobium sp. B4-1-3 TaxID=2589889 RepID=UPI00112EAF8D|nr:hypothetical protein [Mesorhizobium sp. B4-1-3]TPI12465.1 hypothetical protein FJW06_17070 [Mesorhizobium sp. B4-1-3]
MLQRPPTLPGMSIQEIDTPALLIDLNASEANLDHMKGLVTAAGLRVRPHAKTDKSPVIADLQIQRGAIWPCVQKVGEAEILAWSGVPDILVRLFERPERQLNRSSCPHLRDGVQTGQHHRRCEGGRPGSN